VVALLISLKLALLRNGLRASLGQRIGVIVAAVFGLAVTFAGGVALVALRWAEPRWAAFAVVVGGSFLVLGWTLVPVLVAGVDETLDPARFALLPLRARQLAPGLLLAGVLGVPGIVTTLMALATVATWSRAVLPAVLAVPAGAVGVLTCVLASRLVTTAAARALAGRRSREVGALVSVLLLSTIGIWPNLLSHGVIDVSDPAPITDALGWTPFGLPWAVPADAATGHTGRGLLRLALAAGLVVVGLLGWAALLDRALLDRSDSGGTQARAGRSVLDRLPATPLWAVATRSLRYWRRDPRYVMAVVGILAGGLVPVVLITVNSHTLLALVALGPYVGTFLGITLANDIGTDGSAFATHLLVGVPGLVDRLGRVVAVLLWAGPLLALCSVAGPVVAGRPGLVPGCLGAAFGGLLGGLGAASLAAALAPYPVPEAGTNPFRTNTGGSARAVLAQFAVLGVTGGAALPGIALLVLAAVWWPPAAWIGLVVGPVIGAAVLWVGVLLGGRTVEARGPEILAMVRRSV
jgi:ABC-2 type transport system permease protein